MCCFCIENAYTQCGQITNLTEQASSLIAIAIVIVNSHSQLNIVFRISNAYTQYGQIANPTERSPYNLTNSTLSI